MPHTILICAYKTTGKDTFFKKLQFASSDFTYDVYSHLDSNKENIFKKFNQTNIKRFAFADMLKIEAAELYGIPKDIPDEEKEIKQFLINEKLLSARDLYIELGAVRRSENINYWIEKVHKEILLTPDINAIITDWRFPNEYDFMNSHLNNVKTVRIWRKSVPEPIHNPMLNQDTEHLLDNHLTDYLLLPKGDFNDFIKKFPQYEHYIQIDTI